MTAKLTQLAVTCPACGNDVPMPARIVGYGEPGPGNLLPAHVLVNLDHARAHAETCGSDVVRAAVESVGVPW